MSAGDRSVIFPLSRSSIEFSMVPILWSYGIIETSWRLLVLVVKSAVIFSFTLHAAGLFSSTQL